MGVILVTGLGVEGDVQGSWVVMLGFQNFFFWYFSKKTLMMGEICGASQFRKSWMKTKRERDETGLINGGKASEHQRTLFSIQYSVRYSK